MQKLLTAEEVADALGVGKDWVYAEVRAGRIPHVRLGRNVRFRAETVEEWISALEGGRMPINAKRRGAAGTAPGMATGGSPDA